MRAKIKSAVFGLLFCFISVPCSAEVLRIYVDADYTWSRPAAVAIETGIRTAIEAKRATGDLPDFEIIARDNRANSRRSKATLDAYHTDMSALAVFGGVHSPPYLSHRDEINRKGLLLLLPWSAAGPITRAAETSTNWIFRLSIDDRKAGPFLVRRLVKRYRCASPTLLLLDSGWGRANFDSMQREFARLGRPAPKVVFFPASVDTALSDQIAKDIRRSGSDCLILLANAIEGARLINSIYRERNDIRIVSHWGILTGDFSGAVPHVVRQALKIEILQTCGLWVAQMYPERVARILKTAKLGDKGVKKLSEIDASTGFVHGYDLTLLLIAAIDQVQSTQDWAGMDISAKRDAVRAALEDLRTPVEGLLKTYRTPFKPYSQAAPDSHEALGADDLSMVEFSQAGTIANSNN